MTFKDIPQLPLDYAWISNPFKKGSHYGTDFGYRSEDPNPKIKAIADGEVAMKDKDQYGGLFVVLRHKSMIAGKWCYSCYWHLANFDSGYKKGDKVKRGQVLGIMGKTGNATGKHLHFEFWIGPEGVKFSSKNRKRDAVDPIEYVYAHDGQEVSAKSTQIKRVQAPVTRVDCEECKDIAELKTALTAAQERAEKAEKEVGTLKAKIEAAKKALM